MLSDCSDKPSEATVRQLLSCADRGSCVSPAALLVVQQQAVSVSIYIRLALPYRHFYGYARKLGERVAPSWFLFVIRVCSRFRDQ